MLEATGQEDWAEQTAVQGLALAGWIAQAEGRPDDGVRLLQAAGDREDAADKHPVTPGPIAPARELLGELLLELGRNAEALREFETALGSEPNRLRSLLGAVRGARLTGNPEAARRHETRLGAPATKVEAQRR